jgi:hypothetical protein
MFPTMTTRRPRKRSLRELVREAVGTAVELATLGEATLPRWEAGSPSTAPRLEHPHRRQLGHHPRARRPGTVGARPQVCRSPVNHRPARQA